MLEQINKIKKEISDYSIQNHESLQAFRILYLVKKGKINALFESFRNLESEEKRAAGKPLNELKEFANKKFETASTELNSEKSTQKQKDNIDKSLPVNASLRGGIHPITLVINEITAIFSRIGYTLKEGPEIEDDWHNFSALNFEENHPARDMQDTFFISNDLALRTHTSSVQVRVMEKEKPPLRVLCPGRVYRNEAVSARSNCFFHQIEGLCIDEKINMADMKQTLYYFVQEFFGKDTPVRFRSSYFPFTEPSAEMDVFLGTATEDDYRLTKGTGWLEIMGCGMVDPNVLKNVNTDTEKFSGFAFGMGVDRIAMFRYGIKDIRTMFENDIRFLLQFKSM